jgi:tripartite-type tricarboxylate transporter receptor subunit TctC
MKNKLTRRQQLAWLGSIATLPLLPTAFAQSNPLKVILPFGPGSGVDVIVRSAQVALSKALNDQPVVIENIAGAGGITGTAALVKASPDGNIIAFISNNHSVNPSVYKKIPYDSLNDITPISIVGGSPFVLVVNPNKVAAKTAKELAILIKSKPGEFNYASSGNGTIIHLAGEMFIDAVGADVKHIPYKGMGPMMTDIMSGQVEMGVAAVAAVQGHLKSGALRPIGMMHKSRVNSLPEVPTMAEQGFPDIDIAGWFAVIGPAKMPVAQVRRINEAIIVAFNDPTVKAAMAKQDNFISPTTPQVAAQFLKAEQERYAKLVEKANIKID